MVFSTPDKNPCVKFSCPSRSSTRACRHLTPISRADCSVSESLVLLTTCSVTPDFTLIATTRINAPFRLPSVDDYLDFVRTSASPILQILDRLDETSRTAAWSEIKDNLSVFTTAEGWEGPNELLLTIGRKP